MSREGAGVTAIRIKDAAVLLGVSDDTVRRWIDSGQLASYKDETLSLIHISDPTRQKLI